jgi:quinol monooxygenase YgiN
MSVIMTLRVHGDPQAVERMAKEHPGRMQTMLESAKSHGLIAHRFYGSEGKIMVIDEWPDPQSFHAFFEEMESEIGPMMRAVATSEPEIVFWTKLETGDDVGWDD